MFVLSLPVLALVIRAQAELAVVPGTTPTPAPAATPAAPAATTSAAAPHAYLMVRCTNAQPGKGDKYRDVMMATTAKTMQVRADEGDIAGWIFARAVIPSGAASNCDFMQMNLYRGFPPQRSPIDPYLVKAGLKITRAEWYAQLGETSRLMRVELWKGALESGRAARGQFLRIDYLKVPAEKRNDWVKLERSAWQPLYAKSIAAGEIGAWMLQELDLPGGEGEPYNARALTVFPSWAAMGRTPKASAPIEARTVKLRQLVRSELFEIIEAVWPATAPN